MYEPDERQVSTESVQLLDQDFQIPIAWTKLTIPQQGAVYLKRPRLIDALHSMIDRQLVLVRAPAGYGKTSLLVELACETELQVCWYTLEPQSSDLGIFLIHLILSIARRFPSFGKRTIRTLKDMGGQIHSQLRVLVATLVDEIIQTIPEYFFLLLDDYHVLDESSDVHKCVRLFIDFIPEQCHLIIASRTVPPLPLIRLVARQQMAAIGVDELRFTEQEIGVLVSKGLETTLPAEQVRRLVQQTDGWVTAILLGADAGWDMLLRGPESPPIDLTETGIYDYLMSEVFNNQTPQMQRFLLHTAVLDEMTISLCNELVGQESRPLLRTLDKQNLFISRVEQAGLETSYRYHPLFHDFLISRLLQQDRALYQELNIRAADFYAHQENWFAALTHNLNARRLAQVKEIMLSHYDNLDVAGHRESLARWIDALPPRYISAALQLKRAALANDLEQHDTALRLYTNAIAHFESQGNEVSLAYALIERSYALSRSGGYEESITDCQEALSLLEGKQGTGSLQGRAYRYLGICYAETGDPHSALHFLSLAHQCWQRSREPSTRMALLAQAAAAAYEMQSQFGQALEQCQKALSIWESLENEAGMADALNGIGVAHHRLAEYQDALKFLHTGLKKSQSAGSVRSEAYSLASLGDLYRDLGQFDQALAFYEQSLEKNRVINAAYLHSYVTDARAETLYLTGQTERVQAEIEQALLQESLSKPHKARHRIVLAATFLTQQNSSRARKELESVLLEPALQSEVAFRGHMRLAHVAMIENHPQESKEHLHKAVQLAQKAGLTQPLSVESLNHIQVLEFATKQGGYSEELAKWIVAAKELEKVRKKLAKAGLPETAESRCPKLKIEALGRNQVLKDNEMVSWRTTQAKELFFYLLTHPDGQTKEQIGATIWPEHSQAKLSSIFRSSLFRVRKAIFSEIVLFDGERYRLNPNSTSYYDVQAFEQAFSSAETADNPVQKAYHHRRALEIYRGEFLPDLYAEWVLRFREAQEARYLRALTFLARFNLNHKNHPQAIDFARQILSVDEHHETAYHVLIRAYVRSGQRPYAKRIYDRYQNMLATFDLEPQQSWEQLSR